MSEGVSSYLQYLPAILQEGDFLGRFLLAFEAVLSGMELAQDGEPGANDGLALPKGLDPAGKIIGLEDLLDNIHLFFDPATAPDDFLPWLAQWVAMSLREDWSSETRRDFIRDALWLYRLRGTRKGIEAVLTRSGDYAQIIESDDPARPHYFKVILTVLTPDVTELDRKRRRVRAIVDREKPAHTYYSLETRSPAMRINNDPSNNKEQGPGVFLGRTTVLGTLTSTDPETEPTTAQS